MNKTHPLVGRIGILLCLALPGIATYAQPSVSVGVSVGLPSVQIRAASDFYEPLTPYGEWVVVGSYGRCWRPGRVEANWRPYCNGYWQRTDAGWYWASDEPWAWATYHYGRWDRSGEFGWYWVPQTQWAPAWVSWHSGGGYIGWAPLNPSTVAVSSPQAYVIVEEKRFLEPVRPATVVVNNTTIFNKTVINQAPDTAAIEKVSGRKVQAVPVQQLRQQAEAPVVAKQRTPAAVSAKKVQAPVPNQAQPVEKKAVVAPAPRQAEKPAALTHETAAPAPNISKAKSDAREPVPAAAQSKPAAKSEAKPEGKQPAADKQPASQKTRQNAEKHETAAKEKPAASEKTEPTPAGNDHESKGKE